MAELGAPLLINVLGHAGGTLIFAIFLLLFSARGWSGAQGRYLPALAAILALVWNLGSLLVLSWPVSMATKVYENRLRPAHAVYQGTDSAVPQEAINYKGFSPCRRQGVFDAAMPAFASGLVIAVSFSVLSLLPAVLLHLSLKDSQPALVASGCCRRNALLGSAWSGGRAAPECAPADHGGIPGVDGGSGGPYRLSGPRPARFGPHRRLHVPGAVRHVVSSFWSGAHHGGASDSAGQGRRSRVSPRLRRLRGRDWVAQRLPYLAQSFALTFRDPNAAQSVPGAKSPSVHQTPPKSPSGR